MSGGGYGGQGGWAIWIEALNSVRLNGTLSANAGPARYYSGGGSGGGIFICTPKFTGAAGASMRADGSDRTNEGGPGGGGRIAVALRFSDAERDKLIVGQPVKLKYASTYSGYNGTMSVGVGAGPDYTGQEWRAPAIGAALFLDPAVPRGTIVLVR